MSHSAKILERTSKFLSLVLRHQPEAIGLTLDDGGWVEVDRLIAQAVAHGKPLDRELLEEIVATNDKKRFAFSPDGRRIRASQGHSVRVELGLSPQTPPATLFHGTATRFLASIEAQGLVPGSRQHVHLSADVETAERVGARHGKPLVLPIQAAAMHRDGHVFFLSENGVWLTDAVPVRYIELQREP